VKLTLGIVLALAMFSIAVAASTTTIDDIIYLTEEYPPMNMEGENGVATGVSVDVLMEIIKRLGGSKTADYILIVPWVRGYNEVLTTPNSCLFSMTVTEERLPLFKWVGPVFINTDDAIALKKRGLKVSSPKGLVNLKAGVIRGDTGEVLAEDIGINHIERAPSNDINIKKLNEGIIDIWIYSKSSAMLLIEEMGFDPNDYESIWNLDTSELSFAFHKNVDDELIKRIQRTLDDIKADGTYNAIMEKYGM